MSVHDTWKTNSAWNDRRNKGARWQVRWRDASDTQRKRSFASKDEALIFDAEKRGTVSNAPQTISELYVRWIATKQSRKATTLYEYETYWRTRVGPKFGHMLSNAINATMIKTWFATLTPSVARHCYHVLRGIMETAVDLKQIGENPCKKSMLPPEKKRRVIPLSTPQINTIIECAGKYDLEIMTFIFCGPRFGELAALNADDINDGVLRITKSRSDVGGRSVLSGTKTGEERDVPVPGFLLPRLEAQAERRRGGPLFGPTRTEFGFWRASSWRRIWAGGIQRGPDGDVVRRYEGIRQRAGMPELRTHDLRHTTASLLIKSGASVKAVQRFLGHASAAVTLDIYAELFADDLGELASALDAGYRDVVGF